MTWLQQDSHDIIPKSDIDHLSATARLLQTLLGVRAALNDLKCDGAVTLIQFHHTSTTSNYFRVK